MHMQYDQDLNDLEQLIDRMDNAVDSSGQVSLSEVLNAVGSRSFGPFILVGGFVTASPVVGDIPGVPTIMGLFLLLTTVQLLFREHLWLPDWMLRRSVNKKDFCKALGWMRPVAEFMDRWSRPRLRILTSRTGTYIIGIVCTGIALAMPAMELIPFSANAAGIALTAFGLSLIARDGVMALLAILTTVLTVGLIIYNLI